MEGYRLWRITDKHKQETDRVTQETQGSILSAQAREIANDPTLRHLAFQYEGLQDWRDAAIVVLRSIGWQASCTFEDTLYPMLDLISPKGWE